MVLVFSSQILESYSLQEICKSLIHVGQIRWHWTLSLFRIPLSLKLFWSWPWVCSVFWLWERQVFIKYFQPWALNLYIVIHWYRVSLISAFPSPYFTHGPSQSHQRPESISLLLLEFLRHTQVSPGSPFLFPLVTCHRSSLCWSLKQLQHLSMLCTTHTPPTARHRILMASLLVGDSDLRF